MARTTEKVSLTLSPDVLARVDAAAKAEERSRSFIINRTLREVPPMRDDRLTAKQREIDMRCPDLAPKPTPSVRPQLTTPSIGTPHPLQVGARKKTQR